MSNHGHSTIRARITNTGLIVVSTHYDRPVIGSQGVSRIAFLIPPSWIGCERFVVTFRSGDSEVELSYEWDGIDDVEIPADVLRSAGFYVSVQGYDEDDACVCNAAVEDPIPCVEPGDLYQNSSELKDIVTEFREMYAELKEILGDDPLLQVHFVEDATGGEGVLSMLHGGEGELEQGVLRQISADGHELSIKDSVSRTGVVAANARIDALPEIRFGTALPASGWGTGTPKRGDVYIRVRS